MDPIGVGIIGLGVGSGHLVGYKSEPRTKVVAICDTDEEKLRRVQKEQEVPEITTHWQDLLERDDIGIISVCTPDSLHAEMVTSALEAGKHVLAEKPLAVTLEQNTQIVKAVEKSGKKLISNLILRYSKRFQEVKRLATHGFFGDIFYAEGDYLHNLRDRLQGHWRGQERYNIQLGGGVHLIDLLRWFTNDEIVEVFSYGNKKCFTDEEFKYPDNIVTLLKFKNGCVGKCQTSLGVMRPQFHNLILHGTEASFYNTPDGPGVIYAGENSDEGYQINFPYKEGVTKGILIKHFLDCIEQDKQPLVNVYEAAKTCAVCIAAMESLKSNQPVRVQYPWEE